MIRRRTKQARWQLNHCAFCLPPAGDVRLVSFSVMKEGAHSALQPFGQIPTYEEGDLVLFESGSIVLHIAEQYTGLLPDDANARARAITWMFAALSTVEPVVVQREVSIYLESDKAWHEERLSIVEDRIRSRLNELSARLGFKRAFEAQLAVFNGTATSRNECV